MQSQTLSVTTFSAFQIELYRNSMKLASGTAFFTSVGNQVRLVTNKHNVTGRNVETGECLDKKNAVIPNLMKVLIPLTEPQEEGFICSKWQRFEIPLYTDEEEQNPSWVSHPDSMVDLVGFRFSPKEVNIRNLVLPADGYSLPLSICSRVNVIGYPFGISTDNFPIWSTGYVASEPEIDINNKPLMYIDCRARKGNSGSPVVRVFHPGETVYLEGKSFIAKTIQVYLLGIYSGRIHVDSDIGRVWRNRAILELFDKAIGTEI